jgi:hypothetical protein
MFFTLELTLCVKHMERKGKIRQKERTNERKHIEARILDKAIRAKR